VHDTFSFSFLSLSGIDELRTGVLGWGVSVSLSFLSPPVKAGVLVLIRSSSWVVARSFRYSFCLFFFFLFSLLEKKLHHHSIFVCIYQPKKTSSLILILGLGLTSVW
jgi:hypothetical protein